MRLRSAKLVLAGACLAVLAACARQEAPQAQRPVQRPAAPSPAAPSAAEYLAKAASIDLFLVRSSELALSRSQDQRLRGHARRMVDAHHGTAAQLSLAGRRLNLLPSTVLRPEQQRLLAALEASTQFDQLYLSQQTAEHRAAADLHALFARSGSSPTLKPVAQAAAPVYRQHLQQLQSLR